LVGEPLVSIVGFFLVAVAIAGGAETSLPEF
jgi:hypothetical protein